MTLFFFSYFPEESGTPVTRLLWIHDVHRSMLVAWYGGRVVLTWLGHELGRPHLLPLASCCAESSLKKALALTRYMPCIPIHRVPMKIQRQRIEAASMACWSTYNKGDDHEKATCMLHRCMLIVSSGTETARRIEQHAATSIEQFMHGDPHTTIGWPCCPGW